MRSSKLVPVIWHLVLIGFLSWLVYRWEFFNYSTTHDPLVAMFGNSESITILATVVVGLDIVFMSHTVLRAFVWKTELESVMNALFNDKVASGMLSTWGLATFLDTFLTWFFMSGRQELTGIVDSIPDVVVGYIWVFPIVIAFLSWVAQAALIVTIARSVQELIVLMGFNNYNYVPKPVFQKPQQQSQQKYQPQHRPQHNNQPRPVPVQHVPHDNGNIKPKPIPRDQNQGWHNVSVHRPEPTYHPAISEEPLDFTE